MNNDFEQKVRLVDQKIDDFSKEISGGNLDTWNKVKPKIKEIFLDDSFSSTDKESESLVKILTENNGEVETETIVRAKSVSLGIKQWIEKNIEPVRVYRGIQLETSLVDETKKENPEINDDQVNSVRRLAQNINRLYNSHGGIENQKDEVLKDFKDESDGKVKNTWNDTKGIVGILKQTPQELDELIQEDEEVSKNLEGVKLPYQQNERLASHDRVMTIVKNPEMRQFIQSSKSRFKTLDKISGGKLNQTVNSFIRKIKGDWFKKITESFVNKPIVKTSNGFAFKIGSETARNFVKNSMETLLKNGVSEGVKSVTKGLMKKGGELAGKAAVNAAAKIGIKVAGTGIKTALGASTAGFGYILVAAWEGVKLAGKFVAKLVSSLGLELTNNKFADSAIFVVIAVFVLLFGLNQNIANNVSSLVPETSGSFGNISHGEITYTDDGRIKSCGVDMETDFYRQTKTPMISPKSISNFSKTIKYYNDELRSFIGDQYGKQCGVVYAAQYLAYEFDFWVPYSLGGIYDVGIHPLWGTPHVKRSHAYEGVDCASFRAWAYINGLGYRPAHKTDIPFGDCDAIKKAIEPGDSLQVNEDEHYHTSVVLEYNDTHIKFAHAGGKSGVTTGLVNICTGRQEIDGKGNNFTHLQKRKYPEKDI